MKKTLTIATLLALTGTVALAQGKKLKDVQEISLWAPTGVKADGKLAEWNDSFQAYNKATQLYYTISNDDKNIYMAFKSTDAMNNNKIIAGGITIAVNTEGKKKTDNTYNVTYPVIAPVSVKTTSRPAGGAGAAGASAMSSVISSTMTMPGEPIDAEIVAARRKALIAYKEMKVSGFKDIPDSLISLYNEHGMKTMAGFDDQGNYLYEVAIPLKLIGLEVGSTNALAYNVKLNGVKIAGLPNINLYGGGGLGGGGADPGGQGARPVATEATIRMNGNGSFAGSGGSRSGGAVDYQEMVNPSDFWGKYSLAIK